MKWTCKFCTYFTNCRQRILQHYKSSHCHHGKRFGFPCVYGDCVCYFRSHKSLQTHVRQHGFCQSEVLNRRIKCLLCDFNEVVNVKDYFHHLGCHLKCKETVTCPYNNCFFKCSVYSSLRSHKSRYHNSESFEDFKSELVDDSLRVSEQPDNVETCTNSKPIDTASCSVVYEIDCADVESDNESQNDDESDIKRRLGLLLLRMQAVLHISKSATQEIVDELYDIGVLTGELSKNSIKRALQKSQISDTTIELVTKCLQENNPFSCLSSIGNLGTEYKRGLYYKENFSVIDPVEYVLDGSEKKTFVYVPISKVLPALLNRGDVIDKILEQVNSPSEYSVYQSVRDGLHFKNNTLLSGDKLCISLGLYIDEFEICNPLGTSRKKHKVTAIYWVLADLPVKYRSALSSIYLAILCKSNDLKTFGYKQVIEPLLKDLNVLENQGFYISRLDTCVKGTVLYVSSDNLGAHSFAGFQESFNVERFCRFCLAGRNEIQTVSVRSGTFPIRTKLSYNDAIKTLKEQETSTVDGVKRECVLNELSYFHCVTGFPPDFLHDLLEGIVPVELGLCLKTLIGRKYFTFEELNTAIQNFPYRFSDSTNRPQKITKTFTVNGTIGGNGHENWTLLRLLPLLIGDKIPENDCVWGVILELKDIVEVLASSVFTEEKLCYLEAKIHEHRQLLQEAFPEFKLRPKHHFIEHYPYLIRCFGPLLDFWTIRFEAKHSFFKKVVRDVNNFKNILHTLACRHQLMLAYYMDTPTLFKPAVKVEKISVVALHCLDSSVKSTIKSQFSSVTTVSLATNATIHGTKYTRGMFLSAGSTSGLPDFGKIINVLIVENKPHFIIEPYTAWYIEHLRCYELYKNHPERHCLIQPEDLNHYSPISAYVVRGRCLLSPKAFLLK